MARMPPRQSVVYIFFSRAPANAYPCTWAYIIYIYIYIYIYEIKLSARVGDWSVLESPGIIRKHSTGLALRSKSMLGRASGRWKSLLGCASQPLSVRNRWLSRLLCISQNSTRNHCSRTGRSKLETTAQACSKPLTARNSCSTKLLCFRQHSKTLAPRCFFRTCRRKSLLSVLDSHTALETIARICFEAI